MPRTLRIQPIVVAVAAALAATGCAITPKPLTQEDITQRVANDRRTMYTDQEPVSGPITFEEAAARALKYNLDYRLKLMETALAQGLLDVSRHDMLPRLIAGAGYATRSNEQGGRAIGIEDRVETLRPSSTQEQNRRLANIDLSWNLLDFGVSYYRARQQSNQVLIADERRRRVAQTVLADVRSAYWRAAGAQRLIAQVDQLIDRSNSALNRARQIEQQGLLPQPTALGYQRALLDATTILQLRRQDLELAQAELAALMNLPPGTRFTLADQAPPALPPAPTNLAALEEAALAQRPELREEDLRKRITADDLRRAMLTTLPNLAFNYGWNYDSNRFLYNNDWWEGGVRLSFNLLRLLAIPAINRANEAQAKTDDFRRMALSMAVLTQTRIAAQRYGLAVADLRQAEESARVDSRMLNYARSAERTRVEAELETIRSEARSVLSEYQRSIAYSNAQAAWGRLYNSVGLDVLPEEIAKNDVKTLAESIRRTMSEWERRTFQAAAPRAEMAPAIALAVEGAEPSVKESMRAALERNGFEVRDDAPLRVVARLALDPATQATRRAQWQLVAQRWDGSEAGRAEHRSVVGRDLGASGWDALAQSLVDANADTLKKWVAPVPVAAVSTGGSVR